MKKQFSSIILVLCMAVTLLPTSTLAATDYDIWVGSTRVTSGNASNVLGDGTVSFDEATSTLTLNNANITSSIGTYNYIGQICLVFFGQAATLRLIGDNILDASSISGVFRTACISNKEGAALTISGSGTLSVKAGSATHLSGGIVFNEPLIIDGCKVTAYSENTTATFVCGIWDWLNYGVTIRNGAELTLYAPAENGYGYRSNAGGAWFTVDDTSMVISKGGNSAGSMSITLNLNQFMLGSENYDGTGKQPITSNNVRYKYIEVKPRVIPTVTDFTFTPPVDLTYNGTAKPADISSSKEGVGTVTVKYYKDGVQVTPMDVGTYTAKIDVAIGTSYGSATDITDSSWTFTINPLDITDATVGTFAPLSYNGTEQTPSATVTKDSLNVTGTWSTVTNLGDTTTFTASGNFTGTISDISTGMTKGTPNYTVPTGLTAVFGQTLSDISLPTGFSWTTPTASVGNAGTNSFTATYTPTDTDNYNIVNNINITITVSAKAVAFSIEDIADITYNGAAQSPTVVVKDGATTLTNADYTVSYSNNTNAGTATVTVTGKGNYAGSNGTKTFAINRADVSNTKNDQTISYEGQPYDVSQLFTPDSNAGEPSYTIETGGTGEGGLSGNMLTITKTGTVTIGMATAQTANYNTGSTIIATLTVNRGSQEVPEGITKLNASMKGGSDGKIQNVSTDMEYKAENGEYTDVIGNEITGLSKGEFLVRLKQTALYNESEAVTVTIGEPDVIKADENVPDGITLEMLTQSGDSLDIKVTKASTAAPEITTLSGSKLMAIVLDITAEINSTPAATLPHLVKITLPIPEAANGRSITVFRLHEGLAEAMPEGEENKNDDGEYIVISTDTIVIYAKNFSQYAIAYTKPTSSGGSSSVTPSYKITVTQSEGGKISPETVSVIKNSSKKFTITPNDGYEIEDVLVDGKSAGIVTEYIFEKVTSVASITAKFKAIDEKPVEQTKPTEPTNPEKWENPFTDITENDWFYDAVKFANENRLMNGTSETVFTANSDVTRAMFVTVLYRMENEPNTSGTLFADVEDDTYYAKAVAWAAANGIVKGISEIEFAPNDNITREQMAAIIQRYAKSKGVNISVSGKTDYTDNASISDYAKNAVVWAAHKGIMTGNTDGSFAPQNNSTRAEIAVVLQRLAYII